MFSFYANKKSKESKDVSLDQIVEWIKENPYLAEQKKEIQSIYENPEIAEDDLKDRIHKIKLELPAVTFSGRFEGERKKESLIEHTGYLVIDVDKQDSLADVQFLKKQIIENCPSVVLAFVSPSLRGLKIVHQVKFTSDIEIEDQHLAAFRELSQVYQKRFNVKIDQTGKDIQRLCFLIADDEVYFNPSVSNAFQPSFVVPEELVVQKVDKVSSAFRINEAESIRIIEDVLSYLRTERKSLTESYESWMKVGFVLKNVLGENGKPYFHHFSKQDKNYNDKKVDDQFNKGGNHYSNVLGLGSLIFMAQKIGYKTPKLSRDTRNKLELQSSLDKLAAAGYRFRYNMITAQLEFLKEKQKWKQYSQYVHSEIYINVLGRDLRRDDLSDFLFAIAEPYDPVKAFIDSLPIDQLDNHDHIRDLSNTLKTTNPEITYDALKIWFTGFIRCLLDEDYVNELIPILIGGQGIGKTRWIEGLIPSDWKHLFVSKNLDVNDKDDRKLVATNFWVNMDELSIILSAKSSTEAFKSFMSTRKHVVRLPYDKFETILIRRASILGTSNESEYLRDLTGNRRFISIEASEIDVEHQIDMLKVYAQAYLIYRENPVLAGVLKGEVAIQFEEHNSGYKTSNPYEELVQKYFRPVTHDDTTLFRLTPNQMIGIINNRERNSNLESVSDAIQRSHTNQFGKILRSQKFSRSSTNRINGVQGRYYDVAINKVFLSIEQMQNLGFESVIREIKKATNPLFGDPEEVVSKELTEKEKRQKKIEEEKLKKKRIEERNRENEKLFNANGKDFESEDSDDLDDLLEAI